jgi:hypothetical protein
MDDETMKLRHLAESEQMRARHVLAEAEARSADEWFDIYREIVFKGVQQILEANGAGGETFDSKIAEQRPFWAKVRADFTSHGLPLSEEVEWEGPQVRRDQTGAPNIVEWPTGMHITLYWPAEGTKAQLRFEGQCALVALGFILWWGDFHSQAKSLAGRDDAPTSRIIDPTSREYHRYVQDKAADLRRINEGTDPDPRRASGLILPP